jgi:hypothetical protein
MNSAISRGWVGLGSDQLKPAQDFGWSAWMARGSARPKRRVPREAAQRENPSRTPTRVATRVPGHASWCPSQPKFVFRVPSRAVLCLWRPGNAVSGVTRTEGSNPSRSDFLFSIRDLAPDAWSPASAASAANPSRTTTLLEHGTRRLSRRRGSPRRQPHWTTTGRLGSHT